MPHYRVYILDQRGNLTGAIDLDCADDEEAIERVEAVLEGGRGELWRLVKQFGLDSPSTQLEPP